MPTFDTTTYMAQVRRMEVIIVDLHGLRITRENGVIHIRLPYTPEGEVANYDEIPKETGTPAEAYKD